MKLNIKNERIINFKKSPLPPPRRPRALVVNLYFIIIITVGNNKTPERPGLKNRARTRLFRGGKKIK